MTWSLAIGLGLGLPLTGLALLLVWASPVAFLSFVVASRLLLDSASAFTYVQLLPGVSIVKLYTAFIIVMLGAYLFHKRRLEMKPFGIMAVLMVLAALPGTLMTGAWNGFVDVALGWVYPWLVAVMTLFAVRHSSQKRIATLALLFLLYPIANLAIHGAIFGPKVSDAGSPSYHGTFGHEGNMSYLCLAFIALACGLYGCSKNQLGKITLAGLILVGNVALYLNNYRTSLVAIMAFWGVMLLYVFPRLSSVARINLLLFGGIAFGVLVVKVGPDIAEKLQDIATLISDPGKYFDFSSTDARANSNAAGGEKLMSGRINIINEYMAYYVQAPFTSKITGLGPAFGTEAVGLYAHNEFVAALVEQGIIGLVTLVGVLFAGFVIVRRGTAKGDWIAKSNAALLASILVMTLGTMPFRNVRALMVMGLALGLIESYRRIRPADVKPTVPAEEPSTAFALR
ncbi:MAG: O-antigen ligase family protein [Panacagrimonas sp.]